MSRGRHFPAGFIVNINFIGMERIIKNMQTVIMRSRPLVERTDVLVSHFLHRPSVRKSNINIPDTEDSFGGRIPLGTEPVRHSFDIGFLTSLDILLILNFQRLIVMLSVINKLRFVEAMPARLSFRGVFPIKAVKVNVIHNCLFIYILVFLPLIIVVLRVNDLACLLRTLSIVKSRSLFLQFNQLLSFKRIHSRKRTANSKSNTIAIIDNPIYIIAELSEKCKHFLSVLL